MEVIQKINSKYSYFVAHANLITETQQEYKHRIIIYGYFGKLKNQTLPWFWYSKCSAPPGVLEHMFKVQLLIWTCNISLCRSAIYGSNCRNKKDYCIILEEDEKKIQWTVLPNQDPG